VAIPEGTRPDLLLGVFLARISNQRTDRSPRDSSGPALPSSRRSIRRTVGKIVVCPEPALVFEQLRHVDRDLLDRDDRIGFAHSEPLAARDARYQLRVLSLIRQRSAGLFQLSVRRDVARSGFHFVVLRAAGIASRTRGRAPRIASKSLPAAMGVVPNLL